MEPVEEAALTVRTREAVAEAEVVSVVVAVAVVETSVTVEVAEGEEALAVVASPEDNKVRIDVGLRCPMRAQINLAVLVPAGSL